LTAADGWPHVLWLPALPSWPARTRYEFLAVRHPVLNCPLPLTMRYSEAYKRMRKFAILCVATVLWLSACSSNPPATPSSESKATPKQAEFETGREAFQKMYLSAHNWAPDAQPFRLQSQYSPGAPVSEGKAGVWRTSFASPARRMMKMFMWSGLVGPDAPEAGITFSAEDSWSPTNTSTHIFDASFIKIDSDKALEIAEKNGGSKLTKANPQQPVFFILDWDVSKNQLIWHVVYGEDVDKAKLRIAVNASTGLFERVER
jgi:hypothetical protein